MTIESKSSTAVKLTNKRESDAAVRVTIESESDTGWSDKWKWK